MRQKSGYEGTDFKFEVIRYVEVNVRTELGGEMILPTQRWESKPRKGRCSWEGRQMAKQERPQPQGLPSEQTQRVRKADRQLKKWESQAKWFLKWQNDSNKIKRTAWKTEHRSFHFSMRYLRKYTVLKIQGQSLSGFTINKAISFYLMNSYVVYNTCQNCSKQALYKTLTRFSLGYFF